SIIAMMAMRDVSEEAGVLRIEEARFVTIQFDGAPTRLLLQLLSAYTGEQSFVDTGVAGDLPFDYHQCGTSSDHSRALKARLAETVLRAGLYSARVGPFLAISTAPVATRVSTGEA